MKGHSKRQRAKLRAEKHTAIWGVLLKVRIGFCNMARGAGGCPVVGYFNFIFLNKAQKCGVPCEVGACGVRCTRVKY